MSVLRLVLARLQALWRSGRGRDDRDLDDELRAFVEERVAAHERRGLSPSNARRAALLEVDGVEHVKERVRDGRVGSAVAVLARDVRYGARVLRRAPGYALVVVLTIAIGIGVNATIVSVVHAVLWRALPYPDAARLVVVEADTRALPSAYSASGDLLDVHEQSRLVTGIAQIEGRDASLEIEGEMERVAAARVTDDLLPLLGATPLARGRTLVGSEDADGVTVKGVVISYEFWQRRFQGDSQIVGRHLAVNNFDARIVGVLRRGFRLVLPPDAHVEERVDVYMPRPYAPSLLYRGLPLLGRLAPGVTVARAQAELDGLTSSFAAAHASAYPNGLHLSARPLAEVVARDVEPALAALGVAVGFVLLIACVNVANLLLARGKTREREFAVRRALGATRARLIRQLVAENLVVACLGGACGLLFASFGINVVDWLRPAHLPRQSEIAIDGVVVLWTAGLTLVSAVIFGLVPAFAFTRPTNGQTVFSTRAGSLQLRSRRLHRSLVLAEVALSIVPLVGAGLMLRTFVNLLGAPIGFDAAHVITARIPLNLQAFSSVERRSGFYRDAIARVRELPGVESASVGGPPPLAPVQTTQRVWQFADPDRAPSIGAQQSVMPGYFGVMGISLRAGRDFSDDDMRREQRVAIVDERLAALLWNGDAVGKQIGIGESKRPLEVVGVAAAIRARAITDAGTPVIYVPSHVYEIEQTLVVKTRAPLSTIGPEIKRAVEALGPGRSVFDIRTLDEIVAASIDTTRFTMLVLSGFAVASLVLAGIGLYGTLAYLTSQRTQEFGVRVALGASPTEILRLVIREGGMLAVLGAAIGLGIAVAVARSLHGLLYGVTPLDGVTIGGVVGVVLVMALVAVGVPAWRAARVSPATALRA